MDPAEQYFHCYGCKKGGNAIDFVIDSATGSSSRNQLRLLADQAGIDLPKFGVNKQSVGERQLLLDAHSLACQFFKSRLHTPSRVTPRKYPAQRRFNGEAIARFRIGLAPDAWDGLLKCPLMGKFTPGARAGRIGQTAR